MKQIIFALCVFIALATVDNAAAFYNCVDREGNSIITDNPRPAQNANLGEGMTNPQRGSTIVQASGNKVMLTFNKRSRMIKRRAKKKRLKD